MRKLQVFSVGVVLSWMVILPACRPVPAAPAVAPTATVALLPTEKVEVMPFTLVPTLTVTPDERVVNPENGHRYLNTLLSMLWHPAQAYCLARGGHLPTISSDAENEFVFRLDPDTWLGATDEDKEGVWKWVTGEPWKYTHWNHDEPTNCGGNSCSPEDYLMYWGDGTSNWNDIADQAKTFVCEWDTAH